jgi:hypothetical protein
MSRPADQSYQVTRHADGTEEVVFIPPGHKQSTAIQLSTAEAQILQTFLLRALNRIDPDSSVREK